MKEEAVLAGISSEKIIVIPPFVNLHTGSTLPKTINTPAKILFLGRLSRTKGVHYLIEAGKILMNRGMEIQIDIVGEGYDRKVFEALIPFQLKKHFAFHGWLNHMAAQKLVKDCDILAFPSIYPEAFGLAGIEAMSYGKPVVAFNVGGVNEWLIDKYNGLLVNVKNTEQFAMALSRLIQDKDIYNTYSQNSVLFANQKFTVQKHLDSLVEIYTKAFIKYRSTFDKTTN
jgi:glycosyltransferase involved in cell wall biosynthesis